MATYTTNLNLEKPATSENFNLAKINSNWDKIDAGFGTIKGDIIKQVGTVSSNSSGSFTTTNNSKILLMTVGGGASCGIWVVNVQSSGAINYLEINSGASVSISSSTANSLTVTNSGSVTAFVYAVVFNGSIA